MKYLSKRQNKLVQAIERKDWPAVTDILENEPHLNETVDYLCWTPLIYTARNNAPDDVLENMIETATVECLEQQTSDGFTILHYLVAYARVSAMRRVLEKTNKKINTKDYIIGQTPLHCCLQRRLTHEQHKEVAICLITFGASVTIKDDNGKTPLDFYDENKCKGYEETTRSEKKLDLKELLEKLSTPSEILARGPDAVKAFKDALKNGEITVVNSRLMFLGQEGSGKTSCVKAMLGKVFDKEEPSTDGIVTTKTVFQTVGEDYSIWEEQKDGDEIERTKQIREHAIATNVAKTFDFTASTSSSDRGRIAFPSTSASPLEGTSAASVSEIDPRKKSSLSPVFIRRFKEETISEDTGESTGLLHEMRVSTNQLNEMRKKVIDKLANKSSEPERIDQST
ncbi:uncharacterized protein LOC117124203 [Anneissia japonica]|uniref:uncharacterized protein LOC117124203 n=1 Tax=Anneissia japonica TaxID=1529436 RepID=UPI0014256B15|nr:uncharacterized protein LOC117124203 [Anneissia japonica]